MATARVFKCGNRQAVRLPKQFRVKSKELEIEKRGNEIVLREKPGGMERAFYLLAEALVTNNEKQFRRVRGLKIQNWSR
jgi:antitoxin VapB